MATSLRDLIEGGAARFGVAPRSLWKWTLTAIAHNDIIPEGIALDAKFNHGGRPLTWRMVVIETLQAIDRFNPSDANWARTMMFDSVSFDAWLRKALRAQRISVHPRRAAGNKRILREEVEAFVHEKYPSGIPAGISNKQIARDFYAKTGRDVSERTIRRSQGRK
jgi:hypothetical protein